MAKKKLLLIIPIALFISIVVALLAVIFIIRHNDDKTKTYTINGTKLLMDRSNYSEEAIILPIDDIIIEPAGTYFTWKYPGCLIIETQEQLEYALEWIRDYSGYPTDDRLVEMSGKYPINEYNYLFYNYSFSYGDKYVWGGLVIDNEKGKLAFVLSDETEFDDSLVVPQVECGSCFIAAIPKELMTGRYIGWVNPYNDNPIYCDENYCYNVVYCATDTTELYEIYGDDGYVIQNEDEYEHFLSLSEGISSEFDRQTFENNTKTDYTETVLLIRFFTCDYMEDYSGFENYVKFGIDGDRLIMRYYYEPEGNYTGYAYAIITKRFLPRNISDDWISPLEKNKNDINQ